MPGTIDSTVVAELKDLANKLRIHSISTNASKSG